MKANSKTETEVKAFMNNFARAYKERKIDDLMVLFAPDPDVVLIGTGVDGRLVGKSEIRARAERDWAQSEASSFEYWWTSVSKIDSVALFAAEVTTRAKIDGQEAVFP